MSSWEVQSHCNKALQCGHLVAPQILYGSKGGDMSEWWCSKIRSAPISIPNRSKKGPIPVKPAVVGTGFGRVENLYPESLTHTLPIPYPLPVQVCLTHDKSLPTTQLIQSNPWTKPRCVVMACPQLSMKRLCSIYALSESISAIPYMGRSISACRVILLTVHLENSSMLMLSGFS